MAFPWAAVATGGSGILGPIISGLMNKKENEKNRQYNTDMYWIQEGQEQNKWLQQNEYNEKVWNMQNRYNEQMWHMLNQYNSPMAQMQRYKEAGLNPNLIYGQSNTAPAISTGGMDTANIGKGQYNPTPPHQWNLSTDLSGMMNSYLAFKESSARTNNLEAQNKVLQQEQLIKAAEVIGKGTDNEIKRTQLDTLSKTSLEAAEAAIAKTRIESQTMVNRDVREAAQNSSNLREAAERILNLRGQRVNQELDSQLKQLDIQLRQQGINWNDPWVLRVLQSLLETPIKLGKQAVSEGYDRLKFKFNGGR